MNLCKSSFLIMCLLASFVAKVNSIMRRACHSMEERAGQQSSLAFKATWTR